MSEWLENGNKIDEVLKPIRDQIYSTKTKQDNLEVKQNALEIKQHDLDFKPVDIDLIPPELRTKEQWAEVIPQGIKSKAHFTVTIPTETESKFNDLMVFYQNKFALGRVYKHYVLSIVIHEHWSKLQREGLV